MSTLSSSKLQAVRALVETVPDATIVGLSLALANTPRSGPLGSVRDMVRAEAAERQVRNTVLAPIVGLCRAGRRVGRMTFPVRVIRRMWSGLKADSPTLVAQARAIHPRIDPNGPPPSVLDALCAVAAAGLRARTQADFAAVAEACDATLPAGADAMASCLDLAPLVRRALPQLDGWMGRMTEERAASARLFFRDAAAIASDAGPKFVEMLASRLEEPWQSLRLISVVMDHPAERYLAASEMAGFAEDVFNDIDDQIAIVRGFDPSTGVAAARAAGRAAHQATLGILDFEETVELSKDAPWGMRIAGQKGALARVIEANLAAIDRAVGEALPVESVRFAGRMTKSMPQLTAEPDAALLDEAKSLLAFADEVRHTSAIGGFGAARTKALDKVNDRLKAYTEDLLNHLRVDDAENLDRARRFLEVAAALMALSADERAAQIVRRRAAA